MGGPQVATAIEMSRALRAAQSRPADRLGRLFPDAVSRRSRSTATTSTYVVRGQGEDTLRELLEALARAEPRALATHRGPELAARRRRRCTTASARFTRAHIAPALRYDQLPDPRAYLVKTFLGARTAAHQAALGCRFRCTFCGVAAMFRGAHGVAAGASASTASSRSSSTASAPTRSSSTTTTSSTAKWTWCRCSRCWRGTSCRGGATRAPTRW